MALGITIQNFSFRYSMDAEDALRAISLTIPPRSCCAVLGPTGAGKSTLLHALAGVLGLHHRSSNATGTISIGSVLYKPQPLEILFPTVGLVLQDAFVQLSGFRESVSEEVSFTLEQLLIPASERETRIQETLEMLGIGHLSDRKPSQLSGGELQRVALATILVARPDVLLLDEPTTSFDAAGSCQLISILRGMKKTSTVLLTDTTIDFALAIADQFVVLDSGSIVIAGTRKEFLRRLPEFRELLPVLSWERIIGTLSTEAETGNRRAQRIHQRLDLP